MNIQTVAENLRKTIAGKVKYLVEIEYALTLATTGERMALVATAEFLKININELKVILHDVEQCCEQWNLMSWEINPERMGQ
jgi:hypothetical protein